jgi:hypothetical protein
MFGGFRGADSQAANPTIDMSKKKKAHVVWAFFFPGGETLEVIRRLQTISPGLIDVASIVGEVDST